MAEFKDASLWMKLAFLMTMIGFTLDLFGFAVGVGTRGGSEGAMVCGFLCFLTGVSLILALTFMDEAKDNKIAKICFVVFILIAGLATVIGIAVWGGGSNGAIGAYGSMLGVCAALLAILAGIFGILDLVGVKA